MSFDLQDSHKKKYETFQNSSKRRVLSSHQSAQRQQERDEILVTEMSAKVSDTIHNNSTVAQEDLTKFMTQPKPQIIVSGEKQLGQLNNANSKARRMVQIKPGKLGSVVRGDMSKSLEISKQRTMPQK